MKTLKELIADFILPNGKSLEDINKAFILSGFTEPEIRITVREALMSEEFYLFGMLVKVKSLKKDIEVTRKAVAELDNLIAKIIKEELERAAREARDSKKNTREATVALSTSFEDNKNKFAWPVSGFVSQKFGRQQHPVLKGIVIQNDGVNIQTKQGEGVHSIFNGEVSRVAFTPGIGSTVIIKHGDFFTVYTGLKDISVKQGQKVNTNQEIGNVLSNAEGISELRFQIRKNFDALDPQEWLRN